MNTFYCVTGDSTNVVNNPNCKLLKKACEEKGIPFVQLAAPARGMSFADVPALAEGGIYLLSTTSACFQYAYAIIKKNPQLKTLYRQTISLYTPWHELISDESAGVPTIPAIYAPSEAVDDTLLQQIDDLLDGFPVILKRTGGSHGTGIMLIDSAISLKTTLPHIIQGRSELFVLKKFITSAQNYRVIVLNDEVVGEMLYLPQADDIRTNAVKVPAFEKSKIDDQWKAIAIKATQQKGMRFGGVDLLVDTKGDAYVAEVNTPCNFSRCQLLTGNPIAEQIVHHLCE